MSSFPLRHTIIGRIFNYASKHVRILKFLRANPQIRQYYEESAELDDKLGKLSLGRSMHTGGIFRPHARIVYSMARIVKPDVIVETGVCYGYSSYFILDALRRNGKGHLYSIDPDNDQRVPPGKHVGWLVPEELKDRWTFINGYSTIELVPLLQKLGSIDFFLHDSAHNYETMMFEFRNCWEFLRPGGMLFADDIHNNNAFETFSKEVQEPMALPTSSFGYMVK